MPEGTIRINSVVSHLSKGGPVTYWVGSDNDFSHRTGDSAGHRLALVALLLTAITLLATAGIASAQFVWTSRDLPRNWGAVACSSTGQYLIAACYTQVHGFFI